MSHLIGIENARSDRSKCCFCRKKINKGELRGIYEWHHTHIARGLKEYACYECTTKYYNRYIKDLADAYKNALSKKTIEKIKTEIKSHKTIEEL